MTLRVVFCARESAARTWSAALQAALRERGVDAEVWCREAGDTAADRGAVQAEVAVVWRPPPALFDEQRALRAASSIARLATRGDQEAVRTASAAVDAA